MTADYKKRRERALLDEFLALEDIKPVEIIAADPPSAPLDFHRES